MAVTAKYLQVITTTDSAERAGEIARVVVESRLAACAQVWGPIESTYWWQGKIEHTVEWTFVAKTTSANYPALEQLIKRHHNYEVPEILATAIVEGNPDYLRWLDDNTVPSAQGKPRLGGRGGA